MGRGGGEILHQQGDVPAPGRILYGVGQQIDQDLVEVELVADELFRGTPVDLELQGLALVLGLGQEDGVQLLHQLRQAEGRDVQRRLAALDLAHVQHVVDEAEQVVAGGGDLPGVFPHLLRGLRVLVQQHRKADNGVHGGADVVGHIGQKRALGLVGPVGLGEGLAEEVFLLQLTPGAVIHVPDAQHHAPASVPYPGPHGLELVIHRFIFGNGPVVDVAGVLLLQLLQEFFPGAGLTEALFIVGPHKMVGIVFHALLEGAAVGKGGGEGAALAALRPEQVAFARFQVEVVHQAVVGGQGLDQLHLAALLLMALPLLQLLLGGAVQQEALAQKPPVLPDELHIAHDVQHPPVGVAYTVGDARAVPLLLEGADAAAQPFPVLRQHRGGDEVKARPRQLLLGGIAQYAQGRLVDADDASVVQGMDEDAAVHGGKQGLKVLVFAEQLLLEGPLPGDVDANPHGAHHGAVYVVQRGLVGGEHPLALPGLDDLLRHAGHLPGHDLPLRLDAGGVVLLHVPDIGVALSLDLLPGLFHGVAEAVVHPLMDPVLVLVPDQVGHAVDGGGQILLPLPELLAQAEALLPAQEAEGDLLRRRVQPQILHLGQEGGQPGKLIPARRGDQLRVLPFRGQQGAQGLGAVQSPQVGDDHIRPRAQSGVRPGALRKGMRKAVQRGRPSDQIKKVPALAHKIKLYVALIHLAASSYMRGTPPARFRPTAGGTKSSLQFYQVWPLVSTV